MKKLGACLLTKLLLRNDSQNAQGTVVAPADYAVQLSARSLVSGTPK